ncbi:dihydroorotase [Adhaeribacter rhizoryzae]|uniref:Amidohydrolase family protein n=1 Tax=Adhaeribacter rhizoryzae TaxID=2607907 RepID=A0A5M6DIH0_9BACT|nr:dihydroorotase [Adhaeribacter rhizoryzae]KAA5547387.1 amidohydrolase family protein [Adhaeribacter rhizoryzae]
MTILLKGIQIIHPASSYHNQITNILIQNGHITYIGPEEKTADQVITEPGLCVSIGWLDMRTWVGEPGLEYKEDFWSAAQAAAKGGFTEIMLMPDLQPVIQSKNAVGYVQQRAVGLPVTLHAAGAVTVDVQGKDLTEMIDLNQAGAIAFTDGEATIQQADVLVKALHYVQYFNGLVMQRPRDKYLSQLGLMHEGIVSTRLGLKGIPALAEEVIVSRDLQLLEYSGGKLHFSLLSSAGSVEKIRQAKAKGLAVTCDIASYQVAFTDEDMIDFDTNYKVDPPFRSPADKAALIEGLQDGTIDALVSAHKPQDTESKKLEFDLAEFGIINLETAFAVANTCLKEALNLENIIQKFTTAPRQILNLPIPNLNEGEPANLTLFNPTKKWVPQKASTASKSDNSPFFGTELQGQVFGIVHKSNLVLNPEY